MFFRLDALKFIARSLKPSEIRTLISRNSAGSPAGSIACLSSLRQPGWRPLAILALWMCGQISMQGSEGILLRNAQLDGDVFQFEIVSTNVPDRVVETSDSPSDRSSWTVVKTLPDAESAFSVVISGAERYFRVRSGDVTSENVTGYVRHVVPAGYSILASPFQEKLNLADLAPEAAEGTLAFQFDAATQRWSAVNQFMFGQWSMPEMHVSMDQACSLYAPDGLEVMLVGTSGPQGMSKRNVRPGWSLIDRPVWQDAYYGDRAIFIQDPKTGSYGIATYEMGEWSIVLESLLGGGDGVWYWRGSGGYSYGEDSLAPGAVYFSNWAPAFGVEARIIGPEGRPLEGGAWRAQMYAAPAGTEESNLQPVGESVAFLTGAGAGYFDGADGGIRVIPNLTEPDASVQVRFWKADSGASWEEATVREQTDVFTVQAGGHSIPPMLPGILHGIQNSSPLSQPVILDFYHVGAGDEDRSWLLDILARPATHVRIDGSDDLRNWETITTLWVVQRKLTVNLPEEFQRRSRFYRVVQIEQE